MNLLDPPITLGERLAVVRRRRNLTQARAARRARVALNRWKRWEDDLPTPGAAPPNPGRVRLLPHEWCFLRRRREGLKRADVAAALGVTPTWITALERGEASCLALVNFWLGRA